MEASSLPVDDIFREISCFERTEEYFAVNERVYSPTLSGLKSYNTDVASDISTPSRLH